MPPRETPCACCERASSAIAGDRYISLSQFGASESTTGCAACSSFARASDEAELTSHDGWLEEPQLLVDFALIRVGAAGHEILECGRPAEAPGLERCVVQRQVEPALLAGDLRTG